MMPTMDSAIGQSVINALAAWRQIGPLGWLQRAAVILVQRARYGQHVRVKDGLP